LLSQNIDSYAQWARTHNSVLVVSFDESDVPDHTDNQISTLVVGQMVRPGTYDDHADHYALLRTLEDMYGLPALGRSADAAPLTALFTPGSWQRPAAEFAVPSPSSGRRLTPRSLASLPRLPTSIPSPGTHILRRCERILTFP
jgi:hypothetical protein